MPSGYGSSTNLPALASTNGINPIATTKQRPDKGKSASALQDATAKIVDELDKMASTAVQRRSTTEQRWLRNLRQFHGQYDHDVSKALDEDKTRASIFINVTRPKTNSWSARIADMLFPNDERNYGIDPTPVPNLTQQAKRDVLEAERLDSEAMQAIDQHNAALDAGQEPDPALASQAEQAGAAAKAKRDGFDEAQKALEEARDRAKRMERQIDDRFTEAKYPLQARLLIEDATKLGSGVIKGPTLAGKSRPTWEMLTEGSKDAIATAEKDKKGKSKWKLTFRDTDAPMYRRVNPWHFFPDPDAETLDEAEYTLERHLPNKKMLRRMAREQGFGRAAVTQLLKEGPQNSQSRSDGLRYIESLRAMENGGVGTDGTASPLSDRYVVWEWYGSLTVEEIADIMRHLGRSEEADEFEEDHDELDTQMVRIFFCDRQLLKIEEDYLLDSQEFIYSVFSFEKAEASILGGVGVPHLMENEQTMLNSAVRMMMDNGALASGPQIVLDKEAITPENGSWKLVPRKIWSWASGRNNQRKDPPFTTVNIPMNQEQLSAIIMLALRFIDEAVAMPLIAQGEQGQHITKTSSGMSMLFNSANVVFRRVIKNFDDTITTPVVRRTFDFEMQFNPDDSIKGDMQIEARGTSVLLVREMQSEQLMAIIDRYATHPILGVAIKAYEAMRLVLQAMNINPGDVLLERDDYMEKLKAMSEGGGEESPEAIRAQTALDVAKIDADSRAADGQVQLQIADIRRQTEFAQLAQAKEISLEQVNAMFKKGELDAAVKLATEKEKGSAAERKLAAEIAVERQNAREAREQGMNPTGSGGTISMGGKSA
jgi:hypothetical protein